MSDIVERLRGTAAFIAQATGKENSRWVDEAADEIERLRGVATEDDAGDAATMRGFIREFAMTPSMMASERDIWRQRAIKAESISAPAQSGKEPRDGWVHAPDVPKSWEGRDAWCWDANRGVHKDYIWPDYSREPHHCGGVWFKQYEVPAPPVSALPSTVLSTAAVPETKRWPTKGDTMKFLGKNGYPFELEAASKLFNVGQALIVEDCRVENWSHSVKFVGVPGCYNGVMFELCSVPSTDRGTP